MNEKSYSFSIRKINKCRENNIANGNSVALSQASQAVLSRNTAHGIIRFESYGPTDVQYGEVCG